MGPHKNGEEKNAYLEGETRIKHTKSISINQTRGQEHAISRRFAHAPIPCIWSKWNYRFLQWKCMLVLDVQYQGIPLQFELCVNAYVIPLNLSSRVNCMDFEGPMSYGLT